MSIVRFFDQMKSAPAKRAAFAVYAGLGLTAAIGKRLAVGHPESSKVGEVQSEGTGHKTA